MKLSMPGVVKAFKPTPFKPKKLPGSPFLFRHRATEQAGLRPMAGTRLKVKRKMGKTMLQPRGNRLQLPRIQGGSTTLGQMYAGS